MEAHWHLFRYFFKFVCLKDGRTLVTIGCAALRAKQGSSSSYILSSLTSSNSGWHSEWFYLKNDPESPLPEYDGKWIDWAPEKWSYGPEKADCERLIQGGWDTL